MRPRAAIGCALCALAALALSAPGRAHATRRFPDDVANALGMPSAPPCSLCHAGSTAGRGNVTTPFGLSMRARGMVASSSQSVLDALDKMEADHVDSDGDGVMDTDELTMGTDPNVPAGESPPPPIRYGCSVGRPRGAPGSRLVLLGALVVAALVARRRARRD